jgi:uncharacterized cupin superfamily protein
VIDRRDGIVRPMEIVNLASAELTHVNDEVDGWHSRALQVGRRLGAEWIGGGLYELADGQRNWPYHYHHGVEEWLLVIDGAPAVRMPDGEHVLAPGDVVCFPSGPDGAHAVRGPGRFLILSANREPSIAVYPDSDKIGPRPAGVPEDRLDFRRGDAVGYWDGER